MNSLSRKIKSGGWDTVHDSIFRCVDIWKFTPDFSDDSSSFRCILPDGRRPNLAITSPVRGFSYYGDATSTGQLFARGVEYVDGRYAPLGFRGVLKGTQGPSNG